VQHDLSDFLNWIALWLFVSRSNFQPLALAADLCALRQYMQHMPIIIRWKEPDGLALRLLSQPGFLWQTDGGKRTTHTQALVVCHWWTLDGRLQCTRSGNGVLQVCTCLGINRNTHHSVIGVIPYTPFCRCSLRVFLEKHCIRNDL
jgi:hypothetical protein